ncbi:MAG: adenylate/guanylate cyclase domain-containing protein [Gammaproteobacteria bacterium]|nr:adenylate/guanylate cyclase domain-containing protein [Gammaproteobacteria bacterium]MDH5694452.1 adenylate/guanylate cyclase domain-containing protein [Gammaproteobacteria bacterium]
MLTIKLKPFNITRGIMGLAISSLFVLYALGVVRSDVMQSLENIAYDVRLNLSRPDEMDHSVVIVDIDEKSLRAEGRWPWPRDKVAQMVENLVNRYQVALIGFDVLFAESDNTSGLNTLKSLAEGPLQQDPAYQEQYERLKPLLDLDGRFARALQDTPVVLGYYFLNQHSHGDASSTVGKLPPPVLLSGEYPARTPFVEATGYGAPLPRLMESAASAGFIDMPLVDTDGVMRKMPMLQSYEGHLYESFALAMLRQLMGNPPIELNMQGGYEGSEINLGLESIQVGQLRIPVNERGTALVPYRGRFPSFPYVSATDVLQGKSIPELDNAIVLVGTTAAGLLDLRTTPVHNFFPGVEVHANMITGILDGSVKHRPSYVYGLEFVLVLCIGLLMSLLYMRLRLYQTLLITIVLVSGLVSWNFYAWSTNNIDFPIVAKIAMIFFLFVYHLSYEFFIEQRKKRELTHLFGQYVPPTIVDEMSKNPERFGMGGETRNMTVMFTDIRNFTSLSENADPQLITQLVNDYFSQMTEIIHAHRGTIDKYIGDAIMAFWGAPLEDPQHAENAVNAAMAMRAAQPLIAERFREKGWPVFRMGIGLNSGPMHVGNMGSRFRMAYTVFGDEVNLGSRLEGLTKRYHTSVIVSEMTKQLYPEIVYRELDLVRVVGREKPVKIYEPLGYEKFLSVSELDELFRFHEGLELYRNQQWEEAKKIFFNLLKDDSSHFVYHEYLARTLRMMHEPPEEGWQGVYVLKGK